MDVMWANLITFAQTHHALSWIAVAAASLPLIDLLATLLKWPRLASLSRHATIMAGSIIAGIIAGVASQRIHLADIFSGSDSLVAGVVAGSFTTGLTLYVAMFVIQLPAMGRRVERTLEERVFGVEEFDIKDGALWTALEKLRYIVGNPQYPIYLCNPTDAEKRERSKIVPKVVEEIALGLVLGRECLSDQISDKFTELAAAYDGRFQYVLLLEQADRGYRISGAISSGDFGHVLHPKDGVIDQDVAKGFANRVSSYTGAGRSAFSFEVSGFVTKKIQSPRTIRAAIAGMIWLRTNRALIVQGSSVGIAQLWNLVRLAYGFPVGP